MKILAIESSCDETSAAVIEDGTKIISNVIATSSAMYEKWGGIVPEVAAREQLKAIIPVIIEALVPFTQTTDNRQPTTNNLQPFQPIIEKNIDAIAVTVGPGLIGSLLIGVECAKTIAYVTGKPIIPVNHVLAHMYANFVNRQSKIENRNYNNSDDSRFTLACASEIHDSPIQFPATSLVVSGGHTELFLMTSPKDLKWLSGTIDDAAGEAFDKTARLLGFGSRGGLAIQEAASQVISDQLSVVRNNISSLKLTTDHRPPTTIKLPRPLLHDDTLNFSFSGLKTAILREWNKYNLDNRQPTTDNRQLINTFAFEVQEAITDVLVKKTLKAAEMYQAKSILISGGVSANLRLREKFIQTIHDLRLTIHFHSPPPPLCTDNAAYIGAYAYFRGTPVDWHDIDAVPDLSVEE